MAHLKFQRKLGETWVFELTAFDRRGARQSILGQQLNARLRVQLDGTLIRQETAGAGVTINEAGDATMGDFTYALSTLTGIVAGTTYTLDFGATIGGVPIVFPEDGYVIVEALA